MAPPDQIGLVCPDCGVWNRGGKTACFLCGHRLVTAWPATMPEVPKSPTSPTSPDLVNPYAPPTDFHSPALTFRINSLLIVTAVIAVCLGVMHERLVLGIILAVAVAPALVYTFIVAARRKARGRPIAVLEKVGTFLAALAGVVVIALAAVIAFFVTCIPVAFADVGAGNTGAMLALVTGGTAGVATAAFMTYFLLCRKGRRDGTPRKP